MDGRLTVFKINDFLCSFETGRSEYSIWDETIEMFFTKGILKLKFPAPLLKKNCEIYIYNSHEKNEKKLNIKNSWAFENQAKEFINTIRSNKNSLNPGEDALKDLEIFEKIWKF